jgi:phospholipid-binding lipoprotein MlaA
MPRSAILPALLLALLLPAACANGGGGGQAGRQQPAAAGLTALEAGDPLEPTNRRILDLNLRLDDAVIKPVAQGYRKGLGPWPRTRIRNVIDNMREPRFLANHLLQGRPLAAGETLMRFLINSTAGLGGMFDMAQFGGPPRQPADFGQTLHAWGVADGPYLMWPIAGPSNPRDSVGFVADGFLNPIDWVVPFYSLVVRGVVDGVDTREQNIEALEELRSGSLDFYARLRSVWRQRRDAELGRRTAEGEGLEVLEDPEAPGR